MFFKKYIYFRTECNGSELANKLIVLDEFDGPGAFLPYSSNAEMAMHYKLHPGLLVLNSFENYSILKF